jgi:D-alanine-D-alanine ligase
MKKLTVALLFGGKSGEHEVSLRSAASVLQSLDRDRYDVVPVGITKQGEWRIGPHFTEADFPETLQNGSAVLLPTKPSASFCLQALSSANQLSVDVVFPILHGTYGEDGTLQGLLEMANVAYVGAGVLGSAAAMDKDVTKRLLRDAGLPIVEFETVLDFQWRKHQEDIYRRIESNIGYPCFVKPANLGSSVGISKVRRRLELNAAVDLAIEYDRKVIVEKSVNAREIECSVLGNDDPVASVPGEIIPSNEFYDYNAKYIDDNSELRIPARLDEATVRLAQEYAVRAFRAVDGEGLARVDFLLDGRSGELFLNEINTMPGFTRISMYPKLWEASGIPYPELVDRLVQLALERYADRQENCTTYS